jgi:hypothetical protein
MKQGGIGGGNTRTGLNFENQRDLLAAIAHAPGYTVVESIIYYEGEEVARSYRKHALYVMLKQRGIDYRDHLSKMLLPDDAIYVIVNNTMFIVELKFQNVRGSVDEKLQTCDFKKKQYRKLFAPLNYEVEYIYVLNDWFRKPEYKDVLDYVISVGCQYYFHYLPFHKLGLPVPEDRQSSRLAEAA